MEADYVSENDGQRQRLRALATGLAEIDLRRKVRNGQTVAAILVHIAFWDDYSRAVLDSWEQSGLVSCRTNFNAINAAIAHMAGAVPERSAVQLALAPADDVDRQVERLGAELVAAIEESDNGRILRRAIHRRLHLDQIEQTLAE